MQVHSPTLRARNIKLSWILNCCMWLIQNILEKPLKYTGAEERRRSILELQLLDRIRRLLNSAISSKWRRCFNTTRKRMSSSPNFLICKSIFSRRSPQVRNSHLRMARRLSSNWLEEKLIWEVLPSIWQSMPEIQRQQRSSMWMATRIFTLRLQFNPNQWTVTVLYRLKQEPTRPAAPSLIKTVQVQLALGSLKIDIDATKRRMSQFPKKTLSWLKNTNNAKLNTEIRSLLWKLKKTNRIDWIKKSNRSGNSFKCKDLI